MEKIKPEEVLAVLHKIERKQIRLKPVRCPQSTYAGNVVYEASNGWTLRVFTDCNEWDYLDSVVLPNGVEYDFWEEGLRTTKWDAEYEPIREYTPSPEVSWECYRIPGYLKKEKCDCKAIACTGESNGSED